jgi:transposase-like protein
MTIPVEQRRRWSRSEQRRLVAPSFEPGVSGSEVARSSGIHVSQLFRCRKQLTVSTRSSLSSARSTAFRVPSARLRAIHSADAAAALAADADADADAGITPDRVPIEQVQRVLIGQTLDHKRGQDHHLQSHIKADQFSKCRPRLHSTYPQLLLIASILSPKHIYIIPNILLSNTFRRGANFNLLISFATKP